MMNVAGFGENDGMGGLGADDEYKFAKLLFNMTRPLIADGAFFTITDADLMRMWSDILSRYNLVTVRGADLPEDIPAIVKNALGGAKVLAFSTELKDAFNEVARRGYSFRSK